MCFKEKSSLTLEAFMLRILGTIKTNEDKHNYNGKTNEVDFLMLKLI